MIATSLAILLTFLLLIIVIIAVVIVFIIGLELEHHVKSVWNKFIIAITWKHKTGIDKEIEEKEKEIAKWERQKEKIDRLAELKRREERLFKDVHGMESWECTACGDEFETPRDYGKHISEAHHS